MTKTRKERRGHKRNTKDKISRMTETEKTKPKTEG